MYFGVTLKQLIIFTKVIYHGSLSKAAQKTGLTPSAVSKSLQLLEEQLGVQLLKRTTREVSATQEGNDLYEKLDVILSDLESALNSVSSEMLKSEQHIKITCSIALGTSQLVQIFAQYRKAFPDVHLSVHLSDDFENLYETDYDLALRIGNKSIGNYTSQKLAQINWRYCASPKYLEQYGTPKELQDLKNHKCLVYPGIGSSWSHQDVDEKKTSLINKSNITMQANSSLVLLEAALLAQGVAYLPTYLIGSHIASGALIPLFDKVESKTPHFLYAVYIPTKYKNKSIINFIDFMYNWLNPVPPWDRM